MNTVNTRISVPKQHLYLKKKKNLDSLEKQTISELWLEIIKIIWNILLGQNVRKYTKEGDRSRR